MAIDLNSGINYDHKQFLTEDSFKLIFIAKGFEKTIKFIAKPSEGPAYINHISCKLFSTNFLFLAYNLWFSIVLLYSFCL